MSATPISKGLLGVPFASLFVPAVRGGERQNHTPVRTQKRPLIQVAYSVMQRTRTLVRDEKQPCRGWSVFSLSTYCCAVVILQAAYSIMHRIRPSAQGEQQPCRGWSVGRAGLASAASLPCLQQAKRKQGRRSWSVSSLPHNDCWPPESIPSLSHTGMIDRIFPHMFYL